MKNKDLFDAFEHIDPSMIVEAEPKEAATAAPIIRKKRFKPAIFVVAAALIVAALSVTVVAQSAKNDMEPYWEQVFVTTAEQGNTLIPSVGATETLAEDAAQKLNNISAMPEDVIITGTSDDVRFEVIGVTGGDSAAYVWLEVTLSDALLEQLHSLGELDGLFSGRLMWKLGGTGSGGMNLNYLGTKAELLGTDRLTRIHRYATEDWSAYAGEDGGDQAELVSRPDNTFCLSLRIRSSVLSRLSGKTLEMEWHDLTCRYYAKDNPDELQYTTLAEGEWNISLTFNYEESGITYHPSVNGTQYVADKSDPEKKWFAFSRTGTLTETVLLSCSVHVTPISLRVLMNYDPMGGGQSLVAPQEVSVVMADGTQFEMAFSGGNGNTPNPGSVGYINQIGFFDMPIDHTQVVAVVYNGITLPLDSTTPE